MSTSQQTDPLIGRLVDGRYRVRARIARGGMATVYVATDLRLERRIALKVMHGHLSDDTVFQSRFIQEARAAARLADPNVVNVFDQGQDGDMAYLVMEYLPGITLRDLLRDQRRLTVAQTVTVMDAVLSGLSAAHRAGIVHRDVKPENVLLAEDGRIKIGDFGLARATTANTATGAQLLGTIAYLAPELVTRGTADARSDIYALGIMLYEMLAGEQPFKGEQPMQIAFQHATDSVPRPSVKNPGVPEPLDELVLWATERSPDDRPADAREMLDRLREIERELGISPAVARTAATTVIREEGLASDELTRVLPTSATGPLTTTDDTDNATKLRRATRRRAAKGGWIFALVVLLTALAAGAGWWFGSGPGSLVAVPDVTGRSFAEAKGALLEDTLVAVQEGEHTLDVDEGLVIRTDPGAGQRVEQESDVAVVVSLGPASHEIPKLSGMTVDEATSTLRAANVEVVGASDYFTAADKGLVVNARVTPRDSDEVIVCKDGCTAFEGSTATLSVSLGPVPDVTGMSESKAADTLQTAGLKVSSSEEFSDSVDDGDVISQSKEREGGGTWRPGDTVKIVVSKGPQLFSVPNVVGLTRDEAINALSDHFEVSGVVFPWNIAMNELTEVKSQTPSEGAMLPHGSTVEIAIDVRD